MSLIEHKHYHFSISKEELDMAVSQAFQIQLDRLAQLVSSDRSAHAVTVADAVTRQAEADQAALQAANDELVAEKAAHEADKVSLAQAAADLTDQVAALEAKVSELSAPPPAAPPAA